MSIITDLIGVAIEKIPDAYANISGTERRIGIWQDKLTAWSRIYLPRHRVVIADKNRTCVKCNRVPDELDRFCRHCGNKLTTPDAMAKYRLTSWFCPMCGQEENRCEPTCVRKTHPR